MKCVVITTIFEPSEAIQAFINTGYDLIVVGDSKTPPTYRTLKGVQFLDLEDQNKLCPEFSSSVPLNHYSRKNLGYIFAIERGYQVIADSDDDNIPYESWGDLSLLEQADKVLVKGPKFPNIYSLYTSKHIWPRGYPITQIRASQNNSIETKATSGQEAVMVWQGLADGDPDIDAIYRMTSPDYDPKGNFTFEKNSKIYILDNSVLSPFNSQNTIWVNKALFPFLYLPCTVHSRCADILRSYVLQCCLKKLGGYLGFTGATVHQKRNLHNLLNDFAAEIPLYTDLPMIVETLEGVEYLGNLDDLKLAYAALAEKEVVGPSECRSVNVWLDTVKKIRA